MKINNSVTMHYDHIVVGVGHFGYRVAVNLLSADPWCSLLLINEEHEPPYRRKELNSSFEGYDPEEHRFPPIWGKRNCELRLGVAAAGIDRAQRMLRLSDGSSVHYDNLFLGVGAAPRRLAVPGADLPGISHVWSLGDMVRISQSIKSFTTAMVVGTGILGIDTILELRRREKEVTVVARGETFMSNRFNRVSGELLLKGIEKHGVEVVCNESIQSIRQKGNQLEVTLNGSVRLVDRIFVAIGVQPRIELARSADLKTKTGIMVDECLRTSDPRIYCGGDAAEFPGGIVTQKEGAASRHGEAAALNALGINTPYAVDKTAYGLVVDGHYYVTHGKPNDSLAGVEEVDRYVEDGYEAFYFRDGKLIGATQALNTIENRYGALVRAEIPKALAIKILRLDTVTVPA